MANVYYQEENYENAYILYHKYVTLFVEKVIFKIIFMMKMVICKKFWY
jgi:hypothetical protein